MNVRVKGIFLSILMCISCIGCSIQKEKTVTLAAAASLKTVLDDELLPLFENQYPNISVEVIYASSGDLQTQIENGLEVDVCMFASLKQMLALKEEGFVQEYVDLLENKVVLIGYESSMISSFKDLKNIGNEILVIGNPESVPAGQYAKEILEHFNLWDSLQSKISLATDVTSVLHQVAQKSAKYGIVYATDATLLDSVQIICEADSSMLKTPVVYPLGLVSNQEEANSLYSFLQSEEALKIFEQNGFSIH